MVTVTVPFTVTFTVTVPFTVTFTVTVPFTVTFTVTFQGKMFLYTVIVENHLSRQF